MHFSRLKCSPSSFEVSNNVYSINFILFSEFEGSSVAVQTVARLNNIGDRPYPCLTSVVGETVKSRYSLELLLYIYLLACK